MQDLISIGPECGLATLLVYMAVQIILMMNFICVIYQQLMMHPSLGQESRRHLGLLIKYKLKNTTSLLLMANALNPLTFTLNTGQLSYMKLITLLNLLSRVKLYIHLCNLMDNLGKSLFIEVQLEQMELLLKQQRYSGKTLISMILFLPTLYSKVT